MRNSTHPLFAQLKQPVFLQERIFTLVFLQKNFPATGTDDVLPSQQFIAATVSIENTGNRILDYSPYDFFIQNKTGQLSAPVFTFKLADEYMLGSGKLAPKAKKTGIIVFVIEKSEAPFLLLYKPFTVNQQQPAAGIQL